MELSRPLTMESPVGALITLEGRQCINFGGSSYLGLSGQPEIIEAGRAALSKHGAGYQFARQYGIATGPHIEAESQAASFFKSESAVYIASGYHFGFVALAAVREQFDAIFFDEHAHHCLREAIAVSGIRSHSFRHLDCDDLIRQIQTHLSPKGRPLVVTDGLYSTLGEIAPLGDYVRVIAAYRGRLLVDESHSFGVLGPSGRGAIEHFGIASSQAVFGGSTSKGLGVVGGIIPADSNEAQALRSAPASRSASAGLPAAAAMCAASLRFINNHPELLQRLRANTCYLKTQLRALGLPLPDSIAPVASFVAGDRKAMAALRDQLFTAGIYLLHSNYIGAGADGVIRCGIFADHTREHLDYLVDALRRWL